MKAAMTILAGVAIVLVLACGAFLALTWAPELSVDELKARWAPPPSQFVDVAGMQVHVRDEGPRDDPAPLVLMHGTGSSLHAWDGWVDALKDRKRVIRFDLPGFGLTGPSPDNRYSVDNDVRVMFALLDRIGVQSCITGGNSLGGAVAWRAALAEPARVEKLILVDAGGYPFHSTSEPIGFRLLRIPGVTWLMQHTLPRFLVEQGARNVYGDPDRVKPEMIERSIQLTQREGNRRALIERARQRPTQSFAHRIPELKLPTLIIWGGRDRLLPPDDAERFHRDIPGSTLVIFDDLGHAPEEEDPARTIAAVKKFLGIE
jgi:pimeloyl-ACP methyl ester carboxylesterase